ncbi:DUF4192 family protein [Microbacterium sp. NPDC055903]
MTTVMKAKGSADFLALVPVLAGCTPTRSIVLLPFEGSRTYGALRIDLPGDEAIDSFAEGVARLVGRVERTDAVALVVYSDERAITTGDGLVLPHSVLADHILIAFEEVGLRIVDALCAMPEGWASYLDDEPSLAPLPAPPDDAELDVPTGDQIAGAEVPPVDLATKERAAHALAELRRITDVGAVDVEPAGVIAAAALELLDDMPALVEAVVLHGGSPGPAEAAALLWMMDVPALRDAVLMQWTSDLVCGRAAFEAQLAFGRSGALPASAHIRTVMGEGPRPDMPRLHTALRITRALIAIAAPSDRRGPLALAAWLSWATGRASHAAVHLAELRRVDPRYGFAELLETLIDARPLPDWAFDRRSFDAP